MLACEDLIGLIACSKPKAKELCADGATGSRRRTQGPPSDEAPCRARKFSRRLIQPSIVVVTLRSGESGLFETAVLHPESRSGSRIQVQIAIDFLNMHRSVAWLVAAVSLFASIRSTSLAQSDHQQPFLPESSATEQLFDIEFLELAPFPFKADRVAFAWLRGELPASPVVTDSDLAHATISISILDTCPDGETKTVTRPLQTTAFDEMTHLTIRDSEGTTVKHLVARGSNDILIDTWIIGMFVTTGQWTFEIAAELADGRTLFALTLTQFLEGEMRGC
ncbi:hypothetical protein Q7P36_010287 [Cladosporium allicinum]